MALTPFVGKGIFGAAKTAAAINPILAPAKNMPTWFPALVNKIRSTGKKVREANPGKGDNYMVYTSDNGKYTLEEDIITGNINVYGRGDESQSFDMQYMVSDDIERMSPNGSKFDAEFGMQEKWKTDGPDVELEGDFSDMKGAYNEIEQYATAGVKQFDEQDANKIFNQIKGDGFNMGGRVKYASGGLSLNVENESGDSNDFQKELQIRYRTEIDAIDGLTLEGYLSKEEGEEKAYLAKLKFETQLLDAVRLEADIYENNNGRGFSANLDYNQDFAGGLSAVGNAYVDNYGKGINLSLQKELLSKNVDNQLTIGAYGNIDDDETSLGAQIEYNYANGGPVIMPPGTLPPERGPMHAGIQSLFKQKGTNT